MSDIKQIMMDDSGRAACVQMATEILGAEFTIREITENGKTRYMAESDNGVVCMGANGNGFSAKIDENGAVEYRLILDGKITDDQTYNQAIKEKITAVLADYGTRKDTPLMKKFEYEISQYNAKKSFNSFQNGAENAFRQFGQDKQKEFKRTGNNDAEDFENTSKNNKNEMKRTKKANEDDIDATDREYAERARNNPNARHISLTRRSNEGR